MIVRRHGVGVHGRGLFTRPPFSGCGRQRWRLQGATRHVLGRVQDRRKTPRRIGISSSAFSPDGEVKKPVGSPPSTNELNWPLPGSQQAIKKVAWFATRIDVVRDTRIPGKTARLHRPGESTRSIRIRRAFCGTSRIKTAEVEIYSKFSATLTNCANIYLAPILSRGRRLSGIGEFLRQIYSLRRFRDRTPEVGSRVDDG